VPVLRQVLRDKHQQIHERKLLILLATDGVPTDKYERPDIHTLKSVLSRERIPIDRVPVTIIACTGMAFDFQFYSSESRDRFDGWLRTTDDVAIEKFSACLLIDLLTKLIGGLE
jgi:hypothetical protein